ncbi:MAG: type IV secretory system conjugative DNA transfer family protein [Angelakisella sp.]
MPTLKKVITKIGLGLLAIVAIGFIVNTLFLHLMDVLQDGNYIKLLDVTVFLRLDTYLFGAVGLAMIVLMTVLFGTPSAKRRKEMLSGKAKGIEGALENSRFMNDKERDFNFPPQKYTKLETVKKDGVPVRAVYNPKTKDVEINIASGMHSLIIGATGSGKTTTFINPTIQVLASAAAGSSMICTDPKGELFQLHSQRLVERGYKCMVLDLRDPYSSFRWNPLQDIYDRYQLYLTCGDIIYKRTDSAQGSGLTLVDAPESYGELWYEYNDKAYAVCKRLMDSIRVEKQKIFDEVYEDLNDLISVICPIESKDDPVWEKGARSIIMATVLAMLEDSGNPELEMTRDKFCFYNVNKAIGNSDNDFEQLRNYFAGRSPLSKAVNLSKQVLSAAESTLASYMSIAFDKLSMFNDEGLCALTSATDIDPTIFADHPTALFLKIPDEKDTRHALAAVFILCIYKALVKKASTQADLSLPRNVYFLLDEFGNMPKIDKFDKMITVGRSRKIWFNMVVQSYAQLNNVYGDTIADIIKSNCGLKMFIGSNDIGTCEEFSKLCGNMTISTTSVSSSTGDKSGQMSYSSQIQARPLIYPSDLQKLNNKTDTGNAIIVTFGNYPLKTKYTPSYKCPLYKTGQMSLTEVQENVFFGEDVYYDLGERNFLVLNQPTPEEPEGEPIPIEEQEVTA